MRQQQLRITLGLGIVAQTGCTAAAQNPVQHDVEGMTARQQIAFDPAL